LTPILPCLFYNLFGVPQGNQHAQIYDTLKDFQPLIAAAVALLAAGVAFYSARTNYHSAQDVALKNIAAAKVQTDVAYRNKQTGIVRWLYLRTAECGVTIDRYMFKIQHFLSDFKFFAGLNMRHVKEENFKNVVASFNNMDGVYEKSGLKEVDLEFLVTLDTDDQHNYLLIAQNLLYFDAHLQEFLHFTRRLETVGLDDTDYVHGMLKSHVESVQYSADRHRTLQALVSQRMDKLSPTGEADKGQTGEPVKPDAVSTISNLT
jgi:hypothetical protein